MANEFNIIDFYTNIVKNDQLAQRNAYKVYFEDSRGFDSISQISSLVADLTIDPLANQTSSQQSAIVDFNLRIESIDFPESIRIEAEDAGSVWIKTKRPRDAVDFGTVLKIKFFDTKSSPVDTIMVPWMKEVTKPSWHDDVPYPIVTLVIEFHRLTADANDVAFQTYKFYGAYPVASEFPTPSKSPETIISEGRIVEFEYAACQTSGIS